MKQQLRFQNFFIIFLGSSIFAFGLVTFNMTNNLADGGVSGITLIIRALTGFNPAYSTLLINIPLLLIGGKVLGVRSLIYTIWGTLSLSLNLWIWQQVPIDIAINNDLLIAALLAGFTGGLGSGLVYRAGGTTGGTDIMARILEQKTGLSMGRSLFLFDAIVMVASLIYIDIVHMMYTLIAVFVLSRIVDFVQEGTYPSKGLLIVSNQHETIANKLMEDMGRGVTLLKAEGGFSKETTDVVYCVVNASELTEIKQSIEDIDDSAFISIINVHDVLGEGFTYGKPTKKAPWKNLVKK